MIKFSCFNVIICEGTNANLIGYCLYNHSTKSIQVFSLFEAVLQAVDKIRKQEKKLVALTFSRHGLTTKHKKYILQNVYSKVKITHTEQELIDLANAHCKLYPNRRPWLPVNSIKKAVDYFRSYSFKVHILKFQ